MCWNKKTETSFGLKIDFRKLPGLPSKDTHERALTMFVEECAKKFDETKVRQALSAITVEWWNDIAPSPSTGALSTVVVNNGAVYSGLTIGTKLCKVAWRGKLWRSAFFHELLHVVATVILGTDDPNHQNTLVWKDLEPAANARLVAEQL